MGISERLKAAEGPSATPAVLPRAMRKLRAGAWLNQLTAQGFCRDGRLATVKKNDGEIAHTGSGNCESLKCPAPTYGRPQRIFFERCGRGAGGSPRQQGWRQPTACATARKCANGKSPVARSSAQRFSLSA